MKSLLLLVSLHCASVGFCQQPIAFAIPKYHIRFELPNDKWAPAPETDSSKGIYFFKREEVKDSHDRFIIPAIMLYIEDASKYHQDVVEFSITKQIPFRKRGLTTDTMLIQTKKGYPLTYRNGVFWKTSYTANGIDHILYMAHIIDKHDQGIQLYLDMTKDLGDQYEKELLTTIHSLKDTN
jgi:hypothetical protein